VLNELESYATDGMDEADYAYMRSAIGQRDALQYETPGRKLGLLGNILRYDLPLNYRTRQKTILQETDREVLNALSKKLIQPENMAIVVVGDEATIRKELEELGMPIKKLDEDGFEIKEM
jgi:zinc protease